MKAAELLRRVEERMDFLRLSASELGRLAQYPDIVKNIKSAAAKGRDYQPTTETLYRLAEALQTEPNWLLGIEVKQAPKLEPASFNSPDAGELYAALDGMIEGANLDKCRADALRRAFRRVLLTPLNHVPPESRAATLKIVAELLTREFLEERLSQEP